jgi:hypothetical protein
MITAYQAEIVRFIMVDTPTIPERDDVYHNSRRVLWR